MVPSFFMGTLVFLFILLMFQGLRLTEFVLVHGVTFSIIAKLMGFLTISFLPMIIPMSLLFSVLLTYGRLNADSELIAIKSLGLSKRFLIIPALILSLLAAYMSAQIAFSLAPWGNRSFEVLILKLKNLKVATDIRPGIFSEGFFDMVIYANEVEKETGLLKNVFIYNEKASTPLTIIAEKGKLVEHKSSIEQKATLRLLDGSIHKNSLSSYTKIDFKTYDINLFETFNNSIAKKSPLSFNLSDIKTIHKDPENPRHKSASIELHRRSALAVLCILFALIGVGLGSFKEQRSDKSYGMVICLGLIVLYWILFVSFNSIAQNGQAPPWVALWMPNLLFLIAGLYSIKKIA